MDKNYLGHPSQLYGVEEHRLVGGKGDGMRLLEVRNGRGLAFTVSADRNADLSRLSFKGGNYGYFAPCGYVSPSYYDGVGDGFLKSFTAGFLTTSGLNNVGSCCTDGAEELPLHGTIANTPVEHIGWWIGDDEIIIRSETNDGRLFAHKLRLERTYRCSLRENSLILQDKVINEGDSACPAELLYHINIGYPLLCEESEVFIPSQRVLPRDERAAEGIETWDQMLPPTAGFEEQCYFHYFEKEGIAAVYSPILGTGLVIRFDIKNLPFFTQWKMMGRRDYVLGLEPGNAHPVGLARLREEGQLTVLEPGERVEYEVKFEMLESKEVFHALKRAL